MGEIYQRDIIGYVEGLAGHRLHDDEGPQFGAVQPAVTGLTVCWAADPGAIRAAAAAGHNFIICHEALTYPYPAFTEGRERGYLSWNTNAQRLSLLGAHGISVCRMHGTIDELFIFDAFAEQLGLTEIVGRGDVYYEKIYAIEPTPYAELIERVKRTMNMAGVRATPGDPERLIRRIGLPWGGLGLFVNVHMPQRLIEIGSVDVMIAGETDNYGFRFCKEIGVDVIETSHELSETRGLSILADKLRQAFPALEVAYFDNEAAWEMY